jgi:hypothetical protein
MKMAVLWDTEPCDLLETDRRFGSDYCLHRYGTDGGNKYL